ncbi:hypothetical protein DCO58_03810 [Helicobacter saguini]|uniref:Peptidyl-tRNA hydrolase n=1 Tax=Helicobacter saguini TaxID=1548018 RepID=A0A347W2U2_9HELI|nr:hypothetical protein [Helicobacter saguini]MWV62511.1 hypothetical protein [Helicobacter saguini]MWV66815.1 hypothetical protein [Helicobacter saguini]MWV69166.1 hypothetical protein [Helicobacter saguini]MWV71279.1 hypothetical protein [Helicobacter saguini]TLD94205.1 hypothetical protein LS64_006830 [Helicobacter saguini]
MQTILIVGLGNITAKYARTRHNIGFMCLDKITSLINNESADSKVDSNDLESRLNSKKGIARWNLHKNLQSMCAEVSLSDFLSPLSSNISALKELKMFKKLDSNEKILESFESKLQEISSKFSNFNVLLVAPTTFMNNSGVAFEKISKNYNIMKSIVIFDDLDTRFGSVNFRLGGSSGGHNGVKSIDVFFKKEYLKVKLGIAANIFLNDKYFNAVSAENREKFSKICEIFKETLESKLHFSPNFKTRSFNQIFNAKILDSIKNIESYFKTLNFNTLHKSYNDDIANYVLSNFLPMESYEINNILEYSSFVIFLLIFELFTRLDSNNVDCVESFMPFDSYNVRFK